MAPKDHTEGGDEAFRTDFAGLVEPLYSYLYLVASRMLQDPEDILDAVQEALTRAWRASKDFRGESTVKTWICRILAYHIIADYWRPRQARPFMISLDDVGWRESLLEPADQRPGPYDIVSVKLDLWRALTTLDPRIRAAILLPVKDGLTQIEIAEIFAVERRTIIRWRHHALAVISERLKVSPEVAADIIEHTTSPQVTTEEVRRER